MMNSSSTETESQMAAMRVEIERLKEDKAHLSRELNTAYKMVWVLLGEEERIISHKTLHELPDRVLIDWRHMDDDYGFILCRGRALKEPADD
jgi:hypothetical protein